MDPHSFHGDQLIASAEHYMHNLFYFCTALAWPKLSVQLTSHILKVLENFCRERCHTNLTDCAVSVVRLAPCYHTEGLSDVNTPDS